MLYRNKKAPFAVGDIVWYFAKRQVADKPPNLTQKWTGLYRVSQVFNEICLELTAVADHRNIIRTTIHYVQAYKAQTPCITPSSSLPGMEASSGLNTPLDPVSAYGSYTP